MTPTHAPALLHAALAAAARGWPVFPLRAGDKRPAGHPERNCPRTGRCADGHRTPEQRATLDPGNITACWQAARYNVGIATGPAGLLVVDLDIPKDDDGPAPYEWAGATDGLDVFAMICERAGERLPTETFTVRTRRGGQHLYFTAPAEKQLRGSAGRLGWKVDTRAWGGYVVAAGSTVGTGSYEIIHDAPPAPLPTWLGDLLSTPPAPAPVPVAVLRSRIGKADRYATAALNGEVAKVAAAATGAQNTTLYNAAYALGRLIVAGTIAEHEVASALTEVALAKGLAPSRIAASIRDGIQRSTLHTTGDAA
ncbi:bifunctional DNA primase/polymerase [Streptomyces sp. NPDC006529]|uniref:bifunctional DNA primase/polymerase n=1 Tax=Streptomyces sp. NPDC006529 TaxID=3157177 RepID=UPI00339E0A9A